MRRVPSAPIPKVHQSCRGTRQRDLTPEREELLRACYGQAQNRPELSRSISELMAHPLFQGFPRYVLSNWAVKLNLIRTPQNTVWSDEEKSLLEKLAGDLTHHQIHRRFKKEGFKRSLGAITTRIYRYRRSRKGDVLSIVEVADVLGCTWDRAKIWVKEGKLKPHHANGHGIFVRPHALARFIREYPDEVGRGRPDIPFLVALLDEFRST